MTAEQTRVREATMLAQASLVLLTWILVSEGEPAPRESREFILDDATQLVATALAEQLLTLTNAASGTRLTAERIKEKFESVLQHGSENVRLNITTQRSCADWFDPPFHHCLIKATRPPTDNVDL